MLDMEDDVFYLVPFQNMKSPAVINMSKFLASNTDLFLFLSESIVLVGGSVTSGGIKVLSMILYEFAVFPRISDAYAI